MSVKQDLINYFDCKRCHQLYDVPKILPCGNSICQQCETVLLLNDQNTIQCPICGEIHAIPHKSLPISVSLQKLMQAELTNIKDSKKYGEEKRIHEFEENLNELKEIVSNYKQETLRSHCESLRNQIIERADDLISYLVQAKKELTDEVSIYERQLVDLMTKYHTEIKDTLLTKEETYNYWITCYFSGDLDEFQLRQILDEGKSCESLLKKIKDFDTQLENKLNFIPNNIDLTSDFIGKLTCSPYEPKIEFKVKKLKDILTIQCGQKMSSSFNRYPFVTKHDEYLFLQVHNAPSNFILDVFIYDMNVNLTKESQFKGEGIIKLGVISPYFVFIIATKLNADKMSNYLIRFDHRLEFQDYIEILFEPYSMHTYDNELYLVDQYSGIYVYDSTLELIKSYGQKHHSTEPYYFPDLHLSQLSFTKNHIFMYKDCELSIISKTTGLEITKLPIKKDCLMKALSDSHFILFDNNFVKTLTVLNIHGHTLDRYHFDEVIHDIQEISVYQDKVFLWEDNKNFKKIHILKLD